MKRKVGVLASACLLLGACATSGDEGIRVRQLEASTITTDGGYAAAEDRYEVTMAGKSYTLASDTRLLDEEGALRQFREDHRDALDRMGDIIGIQELSDANAEEYASKVIPIVTATEYEGREITEQDGKYAQEVVDMCFLLIGDEKAQGLHNLLMNGGGLDPASQSFASRLEELSEYLPVLVADNAQFVRDAQNIAMRAAH